MSDRLTGSDLATDLSTQPWQRYGLNANGIFGWQFDTALSDGSGPMYGFGLDFGFAETSEETTKLLFQMLWGETEGGYLPEGGAAVPQTHRSIYIGSESEKKKFTFYDRLARPAFAVSMASQKLLGYGSSYFSNPYEDGGAGHDTFDIASTTYLFGKVRLGSQAWLDIGPGFSYGVQYAGEGSEFNRLQLAFMLQARIGWNAESTVSADDRDTYLGAAADVSAFYGMLHGYAFRFALDRTLTDPQNDLSDYGFDSSGGGSGGPLAIVPSFMFASSLLGGLSGSIETQLRSKAYWGYFATHLAGGIAFAAMEGEAGRTGAIGDFLSAARIGSYAIAGIESPDKRIGMPEREKALRESYVNLSNFLLDSAVIAFGQGLDVPMLSSAGAGASMNIAIAPDQITDMLEDTLYIPGYAAVTNRAALTIHHSWKYLPMFSGMTAAWGGTDKPADINSYMGAQWDGPYHYLFGGLNHNISYGEGGGSSLGFIAGAGVKIARKFVIDARAIYNPWNPESKIDAIFGLTYDF